MPLFRAQDQQAMLDHVVTALATQNKRALNDHDKPVLYRFDDIGCRCAIGHLMSNDELADSGLFEGANKLVNFYKEEGGLFDEDTLDDFLGGLQTAHDDSDTRDEIRRSFLRIAKHYGLSPNVVLTKMSVTWCEQTEPW